MGDEIVEKTEEGWFYSILEQADELFVSNIPIESIKELPTFYKYFFGALTFVAVAVIFIYFTISGYLDGSSPFISLEQSSGICDYVNKPITGTFLATDNGLWEGDTGFNYSRALYVFSLANLEMTNAEYQASLDTFQTGVLDYSNTLSVTQNLPYNLILLMATSAAAYIGNTVQQIGFTANPAYVFNRQTLYGALTMKESICSAQASTTFDVPSATLYTTYSYDSFTANNCQALSVLYSLDYRGFTSGGSVQLNIDTRSLVIAMGLNLETIGIGQLEPVAVSAIIPYSELHFEYSGTSYYIEQFFDQQFPGMTPIGCLFYQATNQKFFCFLKFQNTFALPLFNHQGSNYSYPVYCNCSVPLQGDSNLCDQFALLPGVLFDGQYSTTDSYYPSLFLLIDLVNRFNESHPDNPFVALNDAAFAAQFVSAVYPNQLNTPWGRSAFDFCPNCTFFTVSVADYFNQAISEYYFQLVNGSCSQLFDIASWQLLASRPPTTLTERYFSCVQSNTSSIVNAFGISSGNVGLFISLLSIIFLPISYILLRWANAIPQKEEEYSREEKDLALQELALQLLRARDGVGHYAELDRLRQQGKTGSGGAESIKGMLLKSVAEDMLEMAALEYVPVAKQSSTVKEAFKRGSMTAAGPSTARKSAIAVDGVVHRRRSSGFALRKSISVKKRASRRSKYTDVESGGVQEIELNAISKDGNSGPRQSRVSTDDQREGSVPIVQTNPIIESKRIE